ncbi:MAG: hypothetical protein BWY83_01550 [bacterium ADurb.Bin478]|nr:MAG: hypothetical protein BWY83_01550 [bacterium ADurb.Bin478]
MAVFMPKKPANAEKIPPVKKATGTQPFCTLRTTDIKVSRMTRQTKTMPTTLYCCFRYAMAPLRTYRAICAIRSVPSFALFICAKNRYAKSRAATEPMGASQKRNSAIMLLHNNY